MTYPNKWRIVAFFINQIYKYLHNMIFVRKIIHRISLIDYIKKPQISYGFCDNWNNGKGFSMFIRCLQKQTI